jgi:hypothetical protein
MLSDVDGDGDLDLITFETLSMRWLENQGGGFFGDSDGDQMPVLHPIAATTFTSSILLGDVADADGELENTQLLAVAGVVLYPSVRTPLFASAFDAIKYLPFDASYAVAKNALSAPQLLLPLLGAISEYDVPLVLTHIFPVAEAAIYAELLPANNDFDGLPMNTVLSTTFVQDAPPFVEVNTSESPLHVHLSTPLN